MPKESLLVRLIFRLLLLVAAEFFCLPSFKFPRDFSKIHQKKATKAGFFETNVQGSKGGMDDILSRNLT